MTTTGRARPPQPPSPTRRPRLTRRESQDLTRRRILDAAAEVFAERGFRGASLSDVADRAGYTIGAVYSNFTGKDALFHALMAERLRQVEDDLSRSAVAAPDAGESRDELVARELDRLQAAEDAVPPGWWRLLDEYRAVAAGDPDAWADLVAVERRCRDLIAGQIGSFAQRADVELPLAPVELAELTSALADGLRAAYAEGRSSMSSGQGLRAVVAAMIAAARPRDGSSTDAARSGDTSPSAGPPRSGRRRGGSAG